MKSKYNELVRALNQYIEDSDIEKMGYFYQCFEELKEEIGLADESSAVVIKILTAIDPVFAKKLHPFVCKIDITWVGE